MGSLVARRPMCQLPGREEALGGQDWLRVRPGSQCTLSVCGGWEGVLEVA